MKKIFFFIGAFSFFMFSYSQEASRYFNPIFSFGLVASQVDGDTYAGYNKIGYYLGYGINHKFNKKVEIEFALTALQKGARKNYALDSASRNNPNNEFYLLRLNYVEVPVVLKFNHKRFKFETGGAFGVLIKYANMEQNQNGYYNDKQFKSFDYSYILGCGYRLNADWILNVRYEYSLIPFRDYYSSSVGIYHGQFPQKYFNRGLYNNVLTLSFNYLLPSKASESDGNAR